MERWKKRAVELLGALVTEDKTPSVIPYYPQKTEILSAEPRSIQRAIPEAVGISSLRIASMLSELESERRANIHSITVVKGGRIISEASAPGYSAELPHLSHSMSKTLTGMAIGILVSEGRLSLGERVVDIFPEIPYKDERFSEISVEHLLTMTAGVDFAEAGVVTESEWTAAFFSSSMSFVPGERFAYNSMNSYILSRIVSRRAGMGLGDFLRTRIFAPLGIRSSFIEKSPEGEEKGGFGVYLSAESWARLGMMMAEGGSYRGRRVLPESWVRASVTTRAISPESAGDFNYGYHLWVHREREEFLFNGMLGQNVWICPANDIVVVISAGNNELFQQSPALYIVRKYLAGDLRDTQRRRDSLILRAGEKRFFESRRFARPLPDRRGLLYLLGFKEARPYSTAWDPLLGRYRMRENNCSLLPIFVRCLQNNLRAGIEYIELCREGERLFMIISEGGAVQRIEIGLYSHKETHLEYNREKYIARIMGEATYDVEGKPMFKIEMIFPELPNARMIELYAAGEDAFMMKLSESPNNRIAEPFIESLPVTNPRFAFAKQLLDRRFGGDFLKSKLARLFFPTLLIVREGAEREEELISYDAELFREETRSASVLVSMLLKFMKSDSDDEITDASPEEERRGFFSELFERIRRLSDKK